MMDSAEKPGTIGLLILNEQTRQHIASLLERHHYPAVVIADPREILTIYADHPAVVFFVDWEAVNVYGLGLISQITSGSRGSRIIYLYDKGHRDLIRGIMDLGAYACIMAPYEEWETLTMIRHILTRKFPRNGFADKEHSTFPD